MQHLGVESDVVVDEARDLWVVQEIGLSPLKETQKKKETKLTK